MKLRSIQTLLSGLFILLSSFVSAQSSSDSLINNFLGVFYNQTFPKLQTTIANLDKFKVEFADPTLPQEIVYVDHQQRYLIFDNQIVTDKKTINQYVQMGSLLPSYSIFNLNAYLVEDSDTHQIVYIDQALQYAVVGNGNIFTPDGTNQAFVNADSLIHHALAKELYQSSKQLMSFRQGSSQAPRQITVIAEPNCQFCHDLYLQLTPFIDAGQLSVRWALVFFLQPISRPMGLTILGGQVPKKSNYSSTPVGAFKYNEDFFIVTPDIEIGGIYPTVRAKPKTITQLNLNEQFFLKNYQGTPFILFKNKANKPQFIIGVPDDINAFIEHIKVKS